VVALTVSVTDAAQSVISAQAHSKFMPKLRIIGHRYVNSWGAVSARDPDNNILEVMPPRGTVLKLVRESVAVQPFSHSNSLQ
jgi:hypothetical protein